MASLPRIALPACLLAGVLLPAPAAIAAPMPLRGAPVVAAVAKKGPKKGTLYGGGQIGRSFRQGRHGDVQFVSLAVTRDGKGAKAFVDFNTTCPGADRILPASVMEELELDPRGGLFASGPYREEGPNGSQEGTFRFAGRFVSPDTARGTARLRMTVRFADGRPELACDSGTVGWEVRNPGARGQEGEVEGGAAYFGSSSDSFPFLLRVAGSGRGVAQAALEYNLRCKNTTGGFFRNEVMPPARIRRDTFTGGQAFDFALTPELTARAVSSVKGRFGKSRVTGAWRVRATIVNREGAPVDECDSGRMTWQATR